jgi:predicted ribosome quality control (RQC) complex YloA/Tae2 family protein
MHNNYFFLQKLVVQLRQSLMYARLKQCFSQEKDELVLGFERQNGEDFWIKCVLGSQFSILQFPDQFHRAGRNSVDLFSELLLAEVQAVEMFENERAFSIHLLGDFVLVFKLFGNRSNLILYRDSTYQSQFQGRLKNDQSINLLNINRIIKQDYQAFLENDCQVSSLFPTLGKEGLAYLHRNGFETLEAQDRWRLIEQMLDVLDQPIFYIAESEKGVYLTLFPVDEYLYKSTDPIDALNKLYSFHFSIGEFKKEKNMILAALDRKLNKTQNYLDDLHRQKVLRDSTVPYEEIGNILMANLHAIPANISQVILDDFYRNQPIKIKLNATLSAAQNAENYYRKSKNYSKEVAYWQSNVDKKCQEIIHIQEQISAVELTETRKALKPFMSILTQTKKLEIEGSEIPFKQFEVDGWVIWVGKSAKNNDLLTLKYAKKFDLWLHARDVAGSHVIIRNPNQKVVPKYIVEKAAGLAAYFSKRQSDSLCPVIVTPKKYVRKTKDLLAGQMIVDREDEVVLVKPELID